MHTIPALEIKRRGVAALEEALKKGPVHIIKNNRPACVVLSEEDYMALTQEKSSASSLWELLDHRPWKATRKKQEIKKQIENERDHWER
ncbi:MAG: type II toxin-antitoxin system Phd/YefM family antitoxin [Gammaproteobacteria bacterium]|nr:type II toxin-antitoxin system Phd/YefM family antitoxin [Gammaproteobacteria bacterium]